MNRIRLKRGLIPHLPKFLAFLNTIRPITPSSPLENPGCKADYQHLTLVRNCLKISSTAHHALDTNQTLGLDAKHSALTIECQHIRTSMNKGVVAKWLRQRIANPLRGGSTPPDASYFFSLVSVEETLVDGGDCLGRADQSSLSQLESSVHLNDDYFGQTDVNLDVLGPIISHAISNPPSALAEPVAHENLSSTSATQPRFFTSGASNSNLPVRHISRNALASGFRRVNRVLTHSG